MKTDDRLKRFPPRFLAFKTLKEAFFVSKTRSKITLFCSLLNQENLIISIKIFGFVDLFF
jgi:hypothetical protein